MKPESKNLLTIDDYISSFPKNIQIKLFEIRKAISKAAQEASEKIS
jgi:uncharacterized protein YdhG (YjbR/CyaY superfamily)